MTACESDNTSQQASQTDTPSAEGDSPTDPSAEEKGPEVPQEFYTVTNDFQEYDNQQMKKAILYLKSLNTGDTYVIPPTEYESLTLTNFIIENIKVKGECIEVPAHAFPVMVGVCQSEQCDYVRPLNMVLSRPAHYNLSGIGGWLTPAMSPISPCADQLSELVDTIQPYQETGE